MQNKKNPLKCSPATGTHLHGYPEHLKVRQKHFQFQN